ncbi:protein of unknown function (ATPase, AAA-type 83-159) (plasmid) [Magnetospirillum sp. XM-1]|uniref:AAA family ATPase n=1 Tax=Magnetospirillum sp. XM-1 TaxID=1663591 RepID=UPI00073DE62F|nr:AAA family ATPase [Magnetospirillum sp. XM-1]CUW41980.1 protein of unknown function (ATPase, AAA-type 83-159) [Magnetospirillum sp. XM-1]
MNQPLTPRSAKYRANYEAALAKIDLIDKKAAMSKWDWADIREKIVGVPGDPDRPAKLFGQDEAVDQVIYGIRNRKGGAPAAFLFVGKPGLGKSQLAKILEKALDLPIITFDFANVNPNTGPNLLFGGNPQYTGASEGSLILAIKQNPNGLIVLIDEFEKPILGYQGGPHPLVDPRRRPLDRHHPRAAPRPVPRGADRHRPRIRRGTSAPGGMRALRRA